MTEKNLRDVLHDEIDTLETYRERGDAIAEEAKRVIRDALLGGADLATTLEAVQHVVTEEVDKLTTEAFKEGVEMAKRRRKA